MKVTQTFALCHISTLIDSTVSFSYLFLWLALSKKKHDFTVDGFSVSSTRSVHFLCTVYFYHKYLVLHFERIQSLHGIQNHSKQKGPRFSRFFSRFFSALRFLLFGFVRLFPKIFQCLRRAPLHFFLIFCNKMDVKKSQSFPVSQFSAF